MIQLREYSRVGRLQFAHESGEKYNTCIITVNTGRIHIYTHESGEKYNTCINTVNTGRIHIYTHESGEKKTLYKEEYIISR